MSLGRAKDSNVTPRQLTRFLWTLDLPSPLGIPATTSGFPNLCSSPCLPHEVSSCPARARPTSIPSRRRGLLRAHGADAREATEANPFQTKNQRREREAGFSRVGSVGCRRRKCQLVSMVVAVACFLEWRCRSTVFVPCRGNVSYFEGRETMWK